MNRKWILRMVVGAALLVLLGQSGGSMASSQTSASIAQGRFVLFDDEFDGSRLDLAKWDVFGGNPNVGESWLTLSGADIQSKLVFRGGILQGEIQSSGWKSQNEFTDSSFGFETWSGNNGQCHYGVLLKASGHLAVLSPQPDLNGNCFGDPLYQAYRPVPNWDAIRAGGTVTFTLNWSADGVALEVSGNGREGKASYAGQAVPTVPMKIRLYAQNAETYKIDYVRLFAGHAVYLPLVIRR